jgi:hypothetical protein
MKSKLFFLFLSSLAFVTQGMHGRSAHRFVDFPLEKVDYMYKEQGGPVASLVFELWQVTNDFLEKGLTQKTIYYEKALPAFKKLNTFKRFIDELSHEWSKQFNKNTLVPFFQKMFARNQGKIYLEKLSEQEFNTLLQDVRCFLWDIAHNAPYAREKCVEGLDHLQKEQFELFIATSYEA